MEFIFVLLCIMTVLNQYYGKKYTVMKAIDEHIYIGGLNFLEKHSNFEFNKVCDTSIHKKYFWNHTYMNGSDIGFTPHRLDIPENFTLPKTLAFDNCLNWKDQHPNSSMRDISYDHHRTFHHTQSGHWDTMHHTCTNNFIKGIEEYNNTTLWICGTFGTFPMSFLVDKTSLDFIKILDTNVMSCARYIDEPMAVYRVRSTNQLYVATGWGLYRPDQKDPDIVDNNSIMMYSDWRLYRNLFALPAAMAWVLSSDVNFINVVKETATHLYFFGHEINNQYGLNNQEDRHAWQSFLLRVCKNDPGFKHIPTEVSDLLEALTVSKYIYKKGKIDIKMALYPNEQGYNPSWYRHQVHLPTKHFVTPLKINFGCYIGKRPRSISDNHFWGDTNVIYLNRLADVIFDPNKTIKFSTKGRPEYFGCSNQKHSQIPLIGLFNKPGMAVKGIEPAGALCQLQINQNIFPECGSTKVPYHKYNAMYSPNAYDEIMSLSSTIYSNFYSRTMHRINGHSLHPFWNQGVQIGDRGLGTHPIDFSNIGTCNKSFYDKMKLNEFLQIMNFSNTAWPNELANKLTSINSAVCQYSAAELYGFNATFVVPGVEFKRIFLIKDNITDYVMYTINGEPNSDKRRHTSPLMIVGIISTNGIYYRVVLCDFDNAIANRGENHSDASWYNWCIFRNTDQPYIYRQYAPMEDRERGVHVYFRASSLLQENKEVFDKAPINADPNFHFVKDVIRKDNNIHVLTINDVVTLSLQVDCTLYLLCITCAADPYCMWNTHDRKCVHYTQQQHGLGNYIQDVLDRGFRCAKAIKPNTESVLVDHSKVVSLICSNVGYWRGRIEWKSGNGVLQNSANYSINQDGTILVIRQYNMVITDVSCVGVKDDHDMLFNGTEYVDIPTTKRKVLTTFQIRPAPKLNLLHYILICLVIMTLFVIVVLIIKLRKKGIYNKWLILSIMETDEHITTRA